MEDPWSAGSSTWATPSKPKISDPTIAPSHTPPPSFDVSDPWGTSTATPGPSKVKLPSSPKNGLSTSGLPSFGAEVPTSSEPPRWSMDEMPSWGGTTSFEIPSELDEPEKKEAEDVAPTWGDPEVGKDSDEPVNLDTPGGRTSIENEPSSYPLPKSPETSTPPTAIAPLPIDSSTFQSASLSAQADDQFSSPKLDLPAFETSTPVSPSFGDDFGGYSAGFGANSSDPWGGGGGAWGVDQTPKLKTGFDEEDHAASSPAMEEDDEGGWGGGRSAAIAYNAQQAGMDEEWQIAQKRMRILEERAPREKIEALKEEWKGLIEGVIGLHKLEDGTEDQETAREAAIRKLTDDISETLRSLSSLPSDINTYPTVISTLTTHERHAYALTRPNPAPETSFLNFPTTKRSRRDEVGSDTMDAWTSRSKLGEPDVPVETAPVQEETRSKWSFWRKATVEKPLVTSGGGILEVKNISNEPRSSSTPTQTATGTTEQTRPSSRSGSIASVKPSRPASPSPSPSLPMPNSSGHAPSNSEDYGHTYPSGPVSAQNQNQPAQQSVVSRFFGRLGRRQPSQSSINNNNLDEHDKDMELSADDFSFLDQVPSFNTRQPTGVGNLLSLEPGREESMASLESMLNSKPVALPSPLAPPPAPSRKASDSGRFVAKMATTAATANKTSSMDLLSGLDFGDSTGAPISSPSSSQMTSTPLETSTNSTWDDFLAPSARSPSSFNISSPPPPPPPAKSFSPLSSTFHTPTIGNPLTSMTTPLSPPTQSFSSTPMQAPSQKQSNNTFNDDFDDFADFGESSNKNTNTSFDDFDDFGDFGSTNTTSTQPFASPPRSQPITQSFDSMSLSPNAQSQRTQRSSPSINTTTLPVPQPSTPAKHSPRSSLDHTPTINLLNNASSRKGKQWPAPPSPNLPSITPPPIPGPESSTFSSTAIDTGASNTGSQNTNTFSFPFLSPPPQAPGISRPSSRSTTTDLFSLDNDSPGNLATVTQPSIVSSGTGLLSQPSRAQSPPIIPKPPQGISLATPVNNSRPTTPLGPMQPNSIATSSGPPGKSGLSAQDLSFFDSL